MHFLCLHGLGTNSEIFEMQTAALRYELGDHHTYDFVEGTLPWSIAPEIKSLFAADDQFFAYFDQNSAESCLKALDDLDAFIENEGPYDAVFAFSQGAALAATLIIRKYLQNPAEQHSRPVFKCAIFMSGGPPGDYGALEQGNVKLLDQSADGEMIMIPTANIWGSNDLLLPGLSPQLSKLCQADIRTEFVHEGGHEVPGSGSKDAVTAAVHAIRRTVDKALARQ